MNRGRAAALALALAVTSTPAGVPRPRLLDEAEALLRKEAFLPARRAAENALEQARGEGDAILEARARSLLGRVLDGLGDAPRASIEHRAALSLARAAGDRASESRILLAQGDGHWRRAEYADADRLAREAIAIQRATADVAGEGASLDLLGRIALKDGRYDEALHLLRDAIRRLATGGDARGAARARIDLGLLHLDKREFRQAMEEMERARRDDARRGDREGEIAAWTQIAVVHLVQRAPGEALSALDRAAALAGPDEAWRARIRYLAANAWSARGEPALAVAAHEDAIRLFESLGNDREAAWNHARRSRALVALGRASEAEESLGRAIGIAERIAERRALAYWLYERGRLLASLGRDREAEPALERALSLEEEIRLPYTALVHAELALLEVRRGDPKARMRARRAVEAAEASGNPEMLWIAFHRRGKVERRLGSAGEALAAFRASLAVIERLRANVLPADEPRAGFFRDKQEVFADTVDLLMDLGFVDEALGVSEAARARAFLDLLLDRRPDGETTLALPPGPREIGEEARRRGICLVEYFVSSDRIHVWVVGERGPIRGLTLPGAARARIGRIAGLRSRGGAGAAGAVDRGALRELHDDLIAPIAPWLPTGPESHVAIVPHDVLFLLPFASLVDRDGRYLVERHTLSYAPSIGVLRASPSRSASRPAVLAVGNPAGAKRRGSGEPLPDLPGAESEAESVAAILALSRGDVLVGTRATEREVRSRLSDRTILHFATHAFTRDEAPLESYLALASGGGGDPADDGALSAREVLDLRLRAEIVTLSACDTGLGRIRGEGIAGLSRAFLHAGARSLVVSLWPVADVVGRYQMPRFYAALRDGAGPATALRRSQLDTIAALRRGELRTPSGRRLEESPGLWAPFVVIGEDVQGQGFSASAPAGS